MIDNGHNWEAPTVIDASPLSWCFKGYEVRTYGERLKCAIALTKREPKEVRVQLARSLRISAQALSQVLRGQTKCFTAENNARAARFLGVSAYWLATGEDEPVLPLALSEEEVRLVCLLRGLSEGDRRLIVQICDRLKVSDQS